MPKSIAIGWDIVGCELTKDGAGEMKFFKEDHDLCAEAHLWEHRSISVQLSWWPKDSDWYIRFHATTTGNHPGINLQWRAGHLMFDINFFDERHWDDDNDCFLPLGVI